MRKVTLCGPARDKARLLRGVQDLGCLHVVPLNPAEAAPETGPATNAAQGGDDEAMPDPAEAARALQFLRDAPYQRAQTAQPPPGGATSERLASERLASEGLASVVHEVLAARTRRRELLEQRETLRAKLAALAPWGDFDLPEDASALGGVQPWFYAIPHREAEALARLDRPWIEAARTPRVQYIVVLSRETPPEDLLPVAPVAADARGTRGLRRDMAAIDAELDALEVTRIRLTCHREAIRHGQARALDAAARAHALATAQDAGGIFAIQGWVPAPRVPALRRYVEAEGLAARFARPTPEDAPPTLLDNPPALRAGEDLVGFYHMPPARDWDPTGVLLASFVLFFAVILADAGYGAVLLLLAAAPLGLWRRGAGPRLRRLAGALGVATAGMGLLTGGYFGLTPPPESLAARMQVLDLSDHITAMKLALAVGVLHLSLGNAAWAAAHWPAPAALARLGWIAAALGGLGGWLAWTADQGTGTLAGLAVLGAGLLTVLIFAGGEEGAAPRTGRAALMRRVGGGLLGLTGAVRLFGDVLSYLRLFALGLATTLLAAAFNDLASGLHGQIAGVGGVLAALVLLGGHALTFVLAVVSGLVHGLRLEYIEFYGWGLNGEGYPFKPLMRTEERV